MWQNLYKIQKKRLMIKKVLMLLICFIRVWELTMAQTSVVMGIVTSAEEGRLAIGVPVLIKGI